MYECLTQGSGAGVEMELVPPPSAGRVPLATRQGKEAAGASSWRFVFDGVLDGGSSQADVFDEVRGGVATS